MTPNSIAIKTLFQFAVIKSVTIQDDHKNRDEQFLNRLTNRLFTLAKICYSYIFNTHIFQYFIGTNFNNLSTFILQVGVNVEARKGGEMGSRSPLT